jgi:hypothetical protein
MAQQQLLSTTTLSDLQPIAVGGRPIYELYNQIVAKLREGLGPQYAELFAEPSYNVDNGTLDWFTGLNGKAISLSELPTPQDRAAQAQPIFQLVREIFEYADRLEAGGGVEARLQAQMIRGALVVPRPDDIFLLSGQPVLVNWGLKPAGDEAGPTELIELLRGVMKAPTAVPPTTQPSAAPAPTATDLPIESREIPAMGESPFTTRFFTAPELPRAERRHRWVAWPLWTIFILCMAGIGWLLLRNCAVGTPYDLGLLDRIFVTYCAASETGGAPPSAPADGETPALLAQLAELERRYFQAVQRCPRDCDPPPRWTEDVPPPPPPRTENVPPPAPPPDTELCRKLRENMRPIGAANLVLEWATSDDLDLHVYCPRGGRLFYENKNACGANLQEDVNTDSTPKSNPLEDVRFSSSSPPGEYLVYVHRFKRRNGPAAGTPFKLTLLANGVPVEVKSGTATESVRLGSPSDVVLRFTLPIQSSGGPLPPECVGTPERPGRQQ